MQHVEHLARGSGAVEAHSVKFSQLGLRSLGSDKQAIGFAQAMLETHGRRPASPARQPNQDQSQR